MVWPSSFLLHKMNKSFEPDYRNMLFKARLGQQFAVSLSLPYYTFSLHNVGMYRRLSFERTALANPPTADPREFELLATHHEDEDAQSYVRHEVQTAPLVSRDALDVGEHNFAQRGLLGSVVSVHSKALLGKPVDRRIYINLDAPSSGLVCGVQVGITLSLFSRA
jgi:hypothetical protein